MKKEALNKIQHLINISELMDRKGFEKQSVNAMLEAFKIAEAETYRIASEINNMTKTASLNVGKSKMNELENSFIVTSGIFDYLKGLGGQAIKWLKGRAPSLKGLGTKIKGEIAEDASDEIKDKAAKSLRGRIGTSIERAGDDLAEMRFLTGRPRSQILKEIEDQKQLLNQAKSEIEKQSIQDKIQDLMIEMQNPRKLSDLGKLTAGTAAVGAAGIGGAAALSRRKKPESEPLGSISELPRYEYSRPSRIQSYRPSTTTAYDNNPVISPANIMDIEQRVNNLERVVNAIRAKVGV